MQILFAVYFLTNWTYLFLIGFVNESYSAAETSKTDTMQLVNKYADQTLHGMDTLEEMADKEQFFRKLAADVSGTLDFSQLNKALDETNSDKEAR